MGVRLYAYTRIGVCMMAETRDSAYRGIRRCINSQVFVILCVFVSMFIRMFRGPLFRGPFIISLYVCIYNYLLATCLYK